MLIAAEREKCPVSQLYYGYAIGTRNVGHFQMIPEFLSVPLPLSELFTTVLAVNSGDVSQGSLFSEAV